MTQIVGATTETETISTPQCVMDPIQHVAPPWPATVLTQHNDAVCLPTSFHNLMSLQHAQDQI
ncbi:hypothetical protein E2C01_027192 [Portunus trituberculatus]|uniref:Uncharacterized protein n=1 Tax=Portunus trituberculatus TaxID=210409 RepID=A0A5B7EKP3_PORTR|nr:hypothetical protein [Portunus trituberculatus]